MSYGLSTGHSIGQQNQGGIIPPRSLCWLLLPAFPPPDHGLPCILGGSGLPVQTHSPKHPQTGRLLPLLVAGQGFVCCLWSDQPPQFSGKRSCIKLCFYPFHCFHLPSQYPPESRDSFRKPHQRLSAYNPYSQCRKGPSAAFYGPPWAALHYGQ